jgi:hypothetical protein
VTTQLSIFLVINREGSDGARGLGALRDVVEATASI